MMLYWNTVTPPLQSALLKLMSAEVFKSFRLVGGTALSLYWGHRMSVDIDMFTDAPYGSIDFSQIEEFFKRNFSYVDGEFGGNPGMGRSYFVGDGQQSHIKIDVFYSMDPFFQNENKIDGIRMATVEEIIAMKVEVIRQGGRKKDFWDLHEALDNYSINEMTQLHAKRSEWTHNELLIKQNFTNFTKAENYFDPICLKGKHWDYIKMDFKYAAAK